MVNINRVLPGIVVIKIVYYVEIIHLMSSFKFINHKIMIEYKKIVINKKIINK